MLRRIVNLLWSPVLAFDGEIGKLHDIYFDEATWTVRYLVVDDGVWSSGRKVLIAPRAVASINRNLHTVSVSLTLASLEASPKIFMSKPVADSPTGHWARSVSWRNDPDCAPADMHLCSVRRVLGYAMNAVDGRVGEVKDFFCDDKTWILQYLIVETGNRPLGRRVLVNQDRVRCVDAPAESVQVNQTLAQVERGWEFDADNPPPGDVETALRLGAGVHAVRH
jgi:sporulation protein YlmC with PRC-barrel domain